MQGSARLRDVDGNGNKEVGYAPEGHPGVALLVLHLLVEWEAHRHRAHLEHFVDVLVHAVVFQAAETKPYPLRLADR